MKISLDEALVGYDGKEIKEGAGENRTTVTIRKALEIACLSADPTKWKTGDQKYVVYRMLKRISNEDAVELEFDAKDVVLLKELIGNIYGPAVVGVVYDLLDPESGK